MIKFFTCLLLSLFLNNCFAWSNLGHRLVMQIAYDNLTLKARKTANYYNQSLDKTYASKSLVAAAGWLDSIRRESEPGLALIHYIDYPYTDDHSPVSPPKKVNALTALAAANKTLSNRYSSTKEKAMSLRILIHVIGDIHQPLHTISRYSSKYPHGDNGGNLFYLAKNGIADNLHSYWDSGGGLFRTKKRYKNLRVKSYAYKLEKKWPCTLDTYKPEQWVNESYNLAKKYAYSIKPGTRPNRQYQHSVKSITEQQIAKAGCRLALRVNYLFQ